MDATGHAAGLSQVRRLREPDVHAHAKLFRELLPASVAEAYLALLDQGGRVMSEGDPVDEELVFRHLGYLQFQGMPTLRPIDPLVAISGLLAEVQRELTTQQDRLFRGYAAAAELHQRQLRDQQAVPSVLIQVLTDPDEIADRWTTSIHTARDTFRSIATSAGVLASPGRAAGTAAEVRELCSPDLLADPRGAARIRSAIEAGAEIRTAHTLPTRMVVVDEQFALAGLVRDGTTAALVVRSAVLVAALTQYFDQLWAAATPVVVPSSPRRELKQLGATEREVLALLVHGLKDEAIARHLSLSVRTVRRHIATVMEVVDAPTRFAAGAAAQRLGLLG